jgi:anti-sigma B factor antagonist
MEHNSMKNLKLSLLIREVDNATAIIDIQGEITSEAENTFLDIFDQLLSSTKKNILLNFTGMSYMNSSGIGLLVTLLRRSQSNEQNLLAYGLKDHFRQVFELTQLINIISLYTNEQAALSAINSK